MKWPWTKRVKAAARTAVRFIRATFDSAYTTSQNRRHWAHADFLSANAAARPDVRRCFATARATRSPTTATPAGSC